MRALMTILRAVTGPRLADSIMGDLEEGRRLRQARSPIGARIWFARSLLAVIGYALFVRMKEGAQNALRNGNPMGKLCSDLRHARRSLAARRGAGLTIVLVLALGVGLTSAMFAIADPFVLRPLPYANPDELVVIEAGTAGLTQDAAIPTVAEWRAHTNLFQGLAAYEWVTTTRLRLPERAVALRTMQVTPGLLDVLGLPEPPFDAWGGTNTEVPIVLTAAGSETLSFTDASVSRTLPLHEGGNLHIIGTTPSTFVFPRRGRGDVLHGLTPLDPNITVVTVSSWRENGRSGASSSLTLIARLQPGITPAAAEAALAQPLPSGTPFEVSVEPLAQHLTSAERPLALGALSAGVLILLVCAGNVANLMIARGAYRARELSMREALGASRFDLARLVLVELAILTTGAVALGLVVAHVTLAVARGVIPAEYVIFGTLAVTWRVVMVAVVSGLVVMIIGVLPAALAWRIARRPTFGQQVATDSPAVRALRFGFAAGQSALAMILALGASLLLHSYANLIGQDTGFDGSVTVISVSYPPDLSGVPLEEDIGASIDRLRRLPGVVATAAAIGPLVDGRGTGMGLRIEDKPTFASGAFVTPTFFDAAGMTVVQGRRLTEADAGGGIVINEALARVGWPEESPIGRLVDHAGQSLEVVGIVGDVLHSALDTPAEPTVFQLLNEPEYFGFPVNYVLNLSGEPTSYREPVRQALSDVNRDAIIVQMDTLGARLADSVRDRTFATLMLTLFGIAGVSVSVAGLVGIVAFVVAHRTREIAIRVAIGAQRKHVRRLVAGEAMSAAIAGALGGLLVGRWLSTWLESLVYGIDTGDWTTTLVAAGVMSAVTVLAALIPARRALALEPIQALGVE